MSPDPIVVPPPVIAPQLPEAGDEVPAAQAATAADFIDLRPGWRLRVTTPFMDADALELQPVAEEADGGTITLRPDKPLAYETAFYVIESTADQGLRLRFVAAEVTKDRHVSSRPAPSGWQPQFQREAKLLRLVFLRRVSEHDHNMVIISANDRRDLDERTRNVQAGAAASEADLWVPAGVAVVPEKRAEEGMTAGWIPVL